MPPDVAVAEPVVEPVPSTDSTPPSTEPPVLVPPGTAEPQDQGGEPPAPQEPAPRDPSSYNLEELNQLYGSGKLDNPALVTRRESLIKSAQDRWANEQKNLADLRAEQEARDAELANLKDEAKKRLATERAKIMARPLDEETRDELLTELGNALIEEYHSKTEEVHLRPHLRGMREAYVSIYGNTARVRSDAGKMALPELMIGIYNGGFENGRKTGPDENHVVMTSAELQGKIDAALDEYKAKNPLPGVVTTKGGTGGLGAGDWTYARYMAATPEERRDMPPDVEARIIREESRRRSVR